MTIRFNNIREASNRKEKVTDVRFHPLLIPLVAIGLGLFSHQYVFKLSMPAGNHPTWLVAGIFFCLVGLSINALGLRELKRTNQNPSPRTPTPELVVSGPYRVTRNPMYLGFGVIQIGLGLLLNNLWISLLTVPAWIVVQYVAILPEENYLEEKFGDSYRQYKASVRRWM